MPDLIAMAKDGETIEVHPDTVADHHRVGWRVVERAEAEGGEEPAPVSAHAAPSAALPDDRDALMQIARDMGLKVHHNAGAPRIRAQIEEARASGT